jgi:hypothetical protein
MLMVAEGERESSRQAAMEISSFVMKGEFPGCWLVLRLGRLGQGRSRLACSAASPEYESVNKEPISFSTHRETYFEARSSLHA